VDGVIQSEQRLSVDGGVAGVGSDGSVLSAVHVEPVGTVCERDGNVFGDGAVEGREMELLGEVAGEQKSRGTCVAEVAAAGEPGGERA
jgi:hypothetical protein